MASTADLGVTIAGTRTEALMLVARSPILPVVAFASQTLRILLIANGADRVELLKGALALATTPRFRVETAADGWDAQRQAVAGTYAALVLGDRLGDTDCETLLGRLRAIGVSAPARVLTSADFDNVASAADDYLPEADGLSGTTLVRAIVAMVQRHALTAKLAAANEQLARSSTLLLELAHDLATPLGVVMGMTQVLLQEDTGLSADGRSCLEDVASEARRACEILKRVNPAEAGDGPVRPAVTGTLNVDRATTPEPERQNRADRGRRIRPLGVW